jgi:hypothetical protein
MGENRLAGAASPYLRSAAHQPVDWYAWGPEPFARAAREAKPVLLDIGAVWCHWCHVIDRESYEDPSLAAFLNEHFVCVKVDRDERPDVDTRYQRAVQSITRQGGWPLTGFLTPQAELFFGGTYFPPVGGPGHPGFREVLDRVLAVWRDSRGQVDAQAAAVRDVLAQSLDEALPGDVAPDLLPAATARRTGRTADSASSPSFLTPRRSRCCSGAGPIPATRRCGPSCTRRSTACRTVGSST